jgi:simple sugar transport system ATP-binding protein
MKPLISLQGVTKDFSGITALSDVDLTLYPGEITCLLGDNGAGKSTLINILSGVFRPTIGTMMLQGERIGFRSPHEAQAVGISTVYQDVGIFPLMSIARNFFLAREPVKGWGPLRRIDKSTANAIALQELKKIGIRRVRSADQLVGTLSGGERQALAIGRALFFGARVLVLDEPTSALGVKEAAVVLRLIQRAKKDGIAIVVVTHNAHHALAIGDRFTVLIHGRVAADFARGERSKEELLSLMAGGEEFEKLELELEEDGE